MAATGRQMKMVGFLQAQNCSIAPGSWRHPAGATDFLTPDYFQRVGRVLEEGKFHLAFFDDRLAMPDIYNDDHREAVENGVRVGKMDPVSIITAIGMATSRIGLGITYSTTYYPPFHVARLFASLDHFTKGRVAWNVVTSLNDSEAQNFGAAEHLEHDDRYDVADEFMQTTSELWDSWEDGAVLLDKQTGRFADPAKVHRINHSGESFQVRGPLTVPRSPQGHPVLIQAGQSPRGREFAARWGELLFVIYPTPEGCKAYRDDLRSRAEAAGRDPDSVRVAPAVYVVVGETEEEAQRKLEHIESLANQTDSLTLLSEVFNYDFSQHRVDEPLSDEILASMTGLRGFLDRVIGLSGTSNPSVTDFIKASGRGTLSEFPVFVGTPAQVADQLGSWFQAEACDGFVLAATHMPGAYEDFVNLVVPELQRRGLFREEDANGSLRNNLGFARP